MTQHAQNMEIDNHVIDLFAEHYKQSLSESESPTDAFFLTRVDDIVTAAKETLVKIVVKNINKRIIM